MQTPNLNLTRDLCFFDMETTGADVVKDRIIQLALIKYPKSGGEPIEKTYLVNPEQPIKAEATRVHGMSDADVAKFPTFKLLAVEIHNFLEGCDLVGYNSNKFDLPVLMEEFARVGLDFSLEGRRLIDAMQIFYRLEPRTLRAALRFYCNQPLTNAHDAMADTRATRDVFFAQLQRYEGTQYEDGNGDFQPAPISANDMQPIHDFINDGSRVDFTGRFTKNAEGEIVFNFGDKKGEPAHKNPQTLQWMLQRDFPLQVKQIAKAILNKQLK